MRRHADRRHPRGSAVIDSESKCPEKPSCGLIIRAGLKGVRRPPIFARLRDWQRWAIAHISETASYTRVRIPVNTDISISVLTATRLSPRRRGEAVLEPRVDPLV